MQKNPSTSEKYSPIQRHQTIIYYLSLSNVTFIHIFSNLKINYTNNKIMKDKYIMNYAKKIQHSNPTSSKTNWVSCL